MSPCDEFKTLEQSKTEPKKRQRPELSGEASHSVGRSHSPLLSREQGMYRKGRVPQPAALAQPRSSAAGTQRMPCSGACARAPDRGQQELDRLGSTNSRPRSASVPCLLKSPGLGTHRLRATGRPGPAGGAEDGGGARSGARRLGNALPLWVLQQRAHAREREESLE